MKIMEPKKEPKKETFRKAPDKKTSPVNNNLILSLLIAGAAVFILVSVFNGGSEYTIPYSALEKLVDRTDPKAPDEASIDVGEGTGKVTYSHLSELRVAQYRVTGKVIRTEGDKPTKVTFTTSLTPDTAISDRCCLKRIEFDNAPGPSVWAAFIWACC